MTRWSLLLVPVAMVVMALAGRGLGPVPAAVIAALVGLLVARTLAVVRDNRLRRLALEVNAWMGKTTVVPVHLEGGHGTQQFVSALNALGAAYGRRGTRVEEAQPQLREMIAALPEAALLFGLDEQLVTANDAALELFAMSDGPTTATQALGSAVLVAMVRATLAEPTLHRIETTIGTRTIEASTTPLVGNVLVVARDKSEEVRIEAMRRDFVANASHELKTPVAGIQSLADALEIVLERDPVKARAVVGRLRGEAARLATLVAELMNLRRVDARPSEDELTSVALDKMVEELTTEFAEPAAAAAVTMKARVAPDCAVTAVDQDVRLALRNLLDNAIKYNREGGTVSVVARRQAAEVVIEVRDTGIGIPGKDLGRVFERFHRVDEGRSRDAGGTGLGLSIVRHAVERSGGQVSVSSLLGSGTTFKVTLPAAPGGQG
jgi:signal transduction histidine kinase